MKALTAITALALAACTTVPSAPPVRSDGYAVLGQQTRVGRLVVTPLRVVEDSRCPANVRCVWAGRLVVATRIDGPAGRQTTNMELGRPYIAGGIGIQLSEVRPDKSAPEPIPPQDYWFRYTGG